MHSYTPSLEEFLSKSRRGHVLPVSRRVLGDLETPVSAFKKLDDGRHAFLLESVEGGEKWGRYSFIGIAPRAIVRFEGSQCSVLRQGDRHTRRVRDPFATLKSLLAESQVLPLPGQPRFAGGAVGYIGYECARFMEPGLSLHPWTPGELPEAQFMLTGPMLVFDNLAHTIQVVVLAEGGQGARQRYDEATRQIDQIVDRLRSFSPTHYSPSRGNRPVFTSGTAAREFERRVRRAQEHIVAGDAFQIVLSRELSATVSCDPFEIYRALRQRNPSPYMYFLRFGDDVILGASPESLVRREGDVLEVRPIAGTRPRHGDPAEDLRLEEELRSSEKERSEHVMLVDLGRNDLGRVSEFGTVTTEDLMHVERYSHVMHLVSGVRGTLREGLDSFDVLRACFPAGTVSGAPKVRAMQIIHDLERRRRGIYAGGVGYFGYDGNMDLCIAIRTMLWRRGRVTIGAGAGIVAHSNPRLEYEETRHKAQVLMDAVEAAEMGLE